MPGWGKLAVGAVLGAVGALYATNEEVRKQLPGRARDLPLAVRRRFEAATAAAREASASRRAEILNELEAHGANHTRRGLPPSQEAPLQDELSQDALPPDALLEPLPGEPRARMKDL